MDEQDKIRIKEAFLEAVLNSPDPDRFVDGIFFNNGQPVTRRMLAEVTVEDPQFYEELERVISDGVMTVDEFIDGLKKNPPFSGNLQQCPIKPN